MTRSSFDRVDAIALAWGVPRDDVIEAIAAWRRGEPAPLRRLAACRPEDLGAWM